MDVRKASRYPTTRTTSYLLLLSVIFRKRYRGWLGAVGSGLEIGNNRILPCFRFLIERRLFHILYESCVPSAHSLQRIFRRDNTDFHLTRCAPLQVWIKFELCALFRGINERAKVLGFLVVDMLKHRPRAPNLRAVGDDDEMLPPILLGEPDIVEQFGECRE